MAQRSGFLSIEDFTLIISKNQVLEIRPCRGKYVVKTCVCDTYSLVLVGILRIRNPGLFIVVPEE